MLRMFQRVSRRIDTCYQCCTYNVSALHMQSSNTLYPPVKPKYPPGRWGSIKPKLAWIIQNEADALNEIPKVKERLESMAGKLPGYALWRLNPIEEAPGYMEYKQYVTKTHIIEDDPVVYKTINSKTVENVCRNIRPHIERILVQEHEAHSKHHLFNYGEYYEFQRLHQSVQNTHIMIGHIMQTFYANLAFDAEHLLRSQMDEDVRLETFWKKGGYEEHDTPGKESSEDEITEGNSHQHKSSITLQSKMKSSYLIRTEQPLPEFEAWDASICMGDVAEFPYHPESIFQECAYDRPITVSGHWVGDPCEFHHLSVHVPGPEFELFKKTHSTDLAMKEMKLYALQAGFTSAASQAHNQGFNQYWDLTYPITSQIVVTDGKYFQFGAYQLNTLHLWKNQDANPRRNIFWTSEPMVLFDRVDNGVVVGLNNDILKKIVSCMLLEPVNRGYELRPYLPNEPAPMSLGTKINYKGEEIFETPKIGRWQYPRYPVYF